MVYQGSKNRLAKYLVPIIQKYINDNNIQTYIEPFVGGANVIDKIKCENKIGYDISWPLINLLKYVQEDNDIAIAPEECTFKHYSDVRSSQFSGFYSDEYIALIGYCASYGGRYFEGGYGCDPKGKRNIYQERLKNLRQQAPNLKDIQFYCKDYSEINPAQFSNVLFYLDPPYRNSKQYSKQKIDYEEFYDFVRELSKNNIVLISEREMPEDFTCIWQKERSILQKSDRVVGDRMVEKLFVHSSKHE